VSHSRRKLIARQAIAAIACVWWTGAAGAEGAGGLWSGVWQGTIGKSEVQVCLQPGDEGSRGAYYYRKHLTLIAIAGEPSGAGRDSLQLKESVPGPKDGAGNRPPTEARWQLQAAADGKTLSGTWRDGRKSVPANLSAVVWRATDVHRTPCTSDAFNLPREHPGALATKDAALRGVPYRVLSVKFGERYEAELASFELLRDTPGVKGFNAAQRRALHEEERDVFDCSRGALEFGTGDADYESTVVPKVITDHWAVVEQTGAFDCGGAHPDSTTKMTTWNLDTGETVDVWGWFLPMAAAVERHGEGAERYTTVVMRKPLRKLLAPRRQRSDDCGDAIASADDWMVYPTGKGLGFVPNLAHVDQACANEIVLPWARVLTLLNRPGQEAVAAFRADVEHLSASP
jgi:hypothetical protein